VFGVDSGTPILNPGESAILCFGAVRDMPWVVDGEIVVRKVTQLALSFDHRLIDGELGSRFLPTSPACSRIPRPPCSGSPPPASSDHVGMRGVASIGVHTC
jgi:pyruvate dehydrogenase E2 component (dihydrolipoamide acetyltransferase)